MFSTAVFALLWASAIWASPLITEQLIDPSAQAHGEAHDSIWDPSIHRALQFRDTLPKCSPPKGVVSRAVQPDKSWTSRNTTLLWERLNLPGQMSMKDFYDEELPKEPIVTVDQRGDINTAILRTFARRRGEWSTGTQGLCGCTTLVIISRVGVYASHWWESISFAPELDQRLAPDESDDAVLKRTVLTPIRNGERTSGGYWPQERLDPTKIADNFIRAYLIHPEKTFEEVVDGYRKQWDDIKTTVGEIIPALKYDRDNPESNPRWKEIVYQRKDMNDPALDETAAGKCLVKFDPDDDGKKRVVLWVEDRKEPYHDDSW